jgi:hypothetical protein
VCDAYVCGVCAVHVVMLYVVHFALRVVMLCAQISSQNKSFEACLRTFDSGPESNATMPMGIRVFGLPDE